SSDVCSSDLPQRQGQGPPVGGRGLSGPVRPGDGLSSDPRAGQLSAHGILPGLPVLRGLWPVQDPEGEDLSVFRHHRHSGCPGLSGLLHSGDMVGEGADMDKNEILETSRKENRDQDEREKTVRIQGESFSLILVFAVGLALTSYKLWRGLPV